MITDQRDVQGKSAVASPVRWTTADLGYFEGDRRHRYEIIDGELIVTRAPHWKHQTICANIATALKLWSEQSGLGEVAPAPGVIFSDADNVIPDVVWASYDRLDQLLDEAGHLTGVPELVVEVLSPGEKNEQRDGLRLAFGHREVKLKLYSVQGVQEYWIVDHRTPKVEVYWAIASAP